MLRNDKGDKVREKEWEFGSTVDGGDKAGDDDVDILIKANGDLTVEYRDSGNN